MSVKSETMEVLEAVFTEERTDLIIEEVMKRIKLPWWAKGMAKRVLDNLLPDVILDSVRAALAKEPG